jgi:cytochrome c biogenesis protein
VTSAGRRDAIEAVWAFFVSLKLTLWLLAALAALSAVGTFLSPTPVSFAELHARLGSGPLFGLARAFEIHDLFHSWWFTLLLWALALNLVACTLERLPKVFRLALRPERRLTDEALRDRRYVSRIALAQSDRAAAPARVEKALRAQGFAPSRLTDPDGTVHLYAERGRFSRLGAHVTHLGLLVILAGGIVGRLLGSQGQVSVPQTGESFDAVPVKAPDGTTFPRPLGFTVAVKDFRLLTFADGRPRQYESDLAVYEGDEPAAEQTISVNHPMRWGGWTFYQASYEQVPQARFARLTLTDRLTGATRSVRLLAEQAARMADGVQLGVLEYEQDHGGAGPAVHVEREEDGLVSDFWVLENYPGFDARNREDRWSVDFVGLEPVYLTGIQAVRDPGADVVFFGCAILALGLAQSFYSSHRRLWARIGPREIVLAGTAHRNPQAFSPAFAALERAVRGGAKG